MTALTRIVVGGSLKKPSTSNLRAGGSRSRAKTSGSRPWPGASRRVRRRRWRISRGDGDQPPSKVAIMALPPRSPCPARMSSPAVLEVTWCSHAAMVAASGAVPVPVLRGDLGRVQRHPADQQPPQRSDPPGADREGDARVVRNAGQLPGEVPCVGAHRHPARSPGPLRHSGQGAAQQVRRGRAGHRCRRPGQRPARPRPRPRPPRAAAFGCTNSRR